MRLVLAMSLFLALVGCPAKKPAPKTPASPAATERKDSEDEKSNKTEDKDEDDPGRDPMKGDPCEGGE